MTNKTTKAYTLQFWLLCISSFLFFISFNMLIPELPSFMEKIGGKEYLGWQIGLFTITAAISRPFSGKIADKVGRIYVMIIGVVVCIIMGFLYTLATTIMAFLLLRFLHGFSTGFKPTGTTAYVADIVPFNKRGEAMGYMGLFGSLGMAVGNAIGSPIVLYFSHDALFYASSAFALSSILILFRMKETLPVREKISLKHFKIGMDEIADPKVLAPSITMFFAVFSFGVMLTIMPDFSVHLGIENKGLFFTYFTLSSLGIRLLAGRASDKYGRVAVLKIAYIIAAVAMFYLGVVDSRTGYIMAAVLLGIGVGMSSPTIFAWTIDLSDVNHRGKAMSTVFIALELGIFSGAMIGAFLYDNDSTRFIYAFWSGGVTVLIALGYLMFFSVREKRKASNNPI